MCARAAAVALSLGSVVEAQAQALCDLVLEAETDVAFYSERLSDLTVADRQARRMEAVAPLAQSSTERVLWLAESYRALARTGQYDTFALEARQILRTIRDEHPECDFNGSSSPLKGEVLSARPIATNDTALDRSGKRWTPDDSDRVQPEEAAAGFGGIALVLGIVAYIYWRRYERVQGAQRYPCYIEAELTSPGTTTRCTIEDITTYGAKLYLPDQELGGSDRVAITCDLFALAATVRWSNGAFAGIEFAKPLPQSVLDAAIGAVIRRPSPGEAQDDAMGEAGENDPTHGGLDLRAGRDKKGTDLLTRGDDAVRAGGNAGARPHSEATRFARDRRRPI